MKGFYNASTVEVDCEADHFTQHGPDLNRKGKEQAAKAIVSSIKEIFKQEKKDPHE
jgi:predicted secreted protein